MTDTTPTTPRARAPKVVTDAQLDAQLDALAKLRVPFSPNQIGLLPRAITKEGAKSECRQGTQASADGKYCGGYHVRSIHLDYVGHAAITDRLLEVDPLWHWDPFTTSEVGLPQLDREGGLWITLTVAGMTRIGYGDSQGKTGPNAIKEAIGDALRNAGMRFGMALDLWHKGDLHDFAEQQGAQVAPGGRAEKTPDTPARDWVGDAAKCENTEQFVSLWREAKQLGVDEKVIAKMVAEGEKIREKETKALAAKEFAEESAAEQVKAGFEGRGPAPDVAGTE